MSRLLKLIMKESIQSSTNTLQKIKEKIKEADGNDTDIKMEDIYVVKNKETNKYDIMWVSGADGDTAKIASMELNELPEEDLKELKILKDDEKEESVVLRDEAEKVINESEDEDLEKFMDEHYQEIMDSYNAEMAADEDMDPEEYAAQDNPIDSEVFDLIVQSMYDEYNKTESMKEDYYINVNDGKKEDVDYIIQDVTEIEELNDEDVEAPSIDGLLSLVNESLSEKYGNTWGYMKANSIAKKESLQYAIIDIVTPSILKEAEEAKIKDRAVSKTVILESVPNSKRLVNLKVNTLAGTTRFSQKTSEPAKVFARWLESEYLHDEMVKDFQDKLEARQQNLKDSTESYLKEHPDLANRVNVLNAQAKILKDAKMMDSGKNELQDLMYGLVVEFPFNTTVEESKDEYSQMFDTTDKLVEMLFGKEFVKEEAKSEVKEDKNINKKSEKVKVVSSKSKIEESSLKESQVTELKKGDKLSNGKAEVEIIEVDTEHKLNGQPQVTYRFDSGRTVCYPMNSVLAMLNQNSYKHLNESSSENNEEADQLIKAYFNHKMDLETLHNKLEKVFGNKKDAVEYFRKNENRVKSLKEGYESFKIGEIEGTFNPNTLEVMYSIPSENVKDKKINLTKVPSVDTPYNTDTIIKDYVEKNYGNVPTEEPEDVDVNVDVENEPTTPAPNEEEVNEADELPEEPSEEVNEPEDSAPESETGTASFYKIRQREPVSIDNILEKASEGTNSQESEYIVVKEQTLGEDEMNNLLSDLSKPQSFLQGLEPIDRKNYAFNVVKVTSSSSPYTLFIDNVGYDYPRYIAVKQ